MAFLCLSKMKRCLLVYLCRVTVRKLVLALIFPTVMVFYISFRYGGGSIIFSTNVSHRAFQQHYTIRPQQQQQQHASEDRSHRGGKIILLTYGRSGSSLTSEVIQRDPSVYYIFEPLHNVRARFSGSQWGNNITLPLSETKQKEYDLEATEIMDAFLTCAFENLKISEIHNFQLNNSADTYHLFRCVRRDYNYTPNKAVECFLKARKYCLLKPNRMVKTIRFRALAAQTLMEKHQDLRILYLIRDPRASLSSQRVHFNNFKWPFVRNFSSYYCRTMQEDVETVGQMLTTYGPGRIMILRYESLAQDPLRVSEELYQFLGLNFTSQVKKFVFGKTMAGKNGKHFSTTRSNSTEAANSWRRMLHLDWAQSIDSSCSEVYKMLGYLPVNTEDDLKNTNRSLWKNVDFRGMVL